jgi:hypothetical protein
LPAELPIAAIAPREWLFTNHQRQAVCNAYSMVGTTANGGGVVAFILHIDVRYNGDERREARGYKREERNRTEKKGTESVTIRLLSVSLVDHF